MVTRTSPTESFGMPVATFGTVDQPFISVESTASYLQDTLSKTSWLALLLLILAALVIGAILKKKGKK